MKQESSVFRHGECQWKDRTNRIFYIVDEIITDISVIL
nr:MAG TPA: hypothetical protein [Caudoviricetes sp.]